LGAADAKDGEARVVPIEGELAYLFARRQAARQVRRDDVRMLCPLVFHRDGEPIGDFRKSWATACCAAGVGKLVCPTCCTDVDEEHRCQKCGAAWNREELKYVGKIFHDLRRSSCKNMIQAGVAQNVAMKISGHRTDSMIRRYAIVAESDLRTALQRTQQYLKTVNENVVSMPRPVENGDNSGTKRRAGSKKKGATA